MSADNSYNGKISFGEKVGYSLGDLAANLVFQMIMIYQLKFCKTTLYFCSAFCWCLGRNQFLGPGFVGCLRQFRGTFQNPLQVAVRIQAGFLSRFNQTVKDCATLRTARCIAEQKILPAHHKGLYAALGAVVGKLQPTVLQIAHQIGPLLQKIVQCLAQGGLGCCPGAGLICPCQQSLQNRFFLLQTLGKSLFYCQCGKVLLHLEQLCNGKYELISDEMFIRIASQIGFAFDSWNLHEGKTFKEYDL